MYPPSFGSGRLSTDCSSSQLLSFKFSISKVTEKRAGIPSVAFLVVHRAFLLPAQGVFTANASTTTLNRPHHGTIGRPSADGHPSHRLSVDSRLTVGEKTATDSRLTVDRRSVDGRSTVGRRSVDGRSTVGRRSVDDRTTVGRRSVDCRSTVDRPSVSGG